MTAFSLMESKWSQQAVGIALSFIYGEILAVLLANWQIYGKANLLKFSLYIHTLSILELLSLYSDGRRVPPYPILFGQWNWEI